VNTVTFLLFQHENEKSQLTEIIRLKEMEKINFDKSLTSKDEDKKLQAVTGEKEHLQKQQELEVHLVSMQCTSTICPFVLSLLALMPYNNLLFDLHSLIFSAMPFGWLIAFTCLFFQMGITILIYAFLIMPTFSGP
jgi:hypothetical protein